MPSLLRRKRKPPTLAITRLTLSHCVYASQLRASTLPHLKSLSFTSDPTHRNVTWDDIVQLPPYHGPIVDWAAQLTSLCLDATTTEYLSPHAHLFTNLVARDTRFLWTTERLLFFSTLTSSIRHVRVQPTPEDPEMRERDPTGSSHALAFFHMHLDDMDYDSLRALEHVRLPAASVARPFFDDRLHVKRPDAKLTFDDDREGVSIDDELLCDPVQDDPGKVPPLQTAELELKFNPEFWTFVDDVEEAEIRRQGRSEAV